MASLWIFDVNQGGMVDVAAEGSDMLLFLRY